MYFSRIRIKPEIFRGTQLHKVLSDCAYSTHRLLWDLFPDQKKRNFIYREEVARKQFGDQSGVRGESVYYLVSSEKPYVQNPVFSVESKQYNPCLQQGDTLRFELRANPVVTRDGKKHDVAMDAQQSFMKRLCNDLEIMSNLKRSPEKKELKKELLAHGGTALEEKLTDLLKGDFRYADHLEQPLSLKEKLELSLKAIIDKELEKWIIGQGERNGFTIAMDAYGTPKIQNSAYQWHALPKKAPKGAKSGFSSVDFTGDLEVTDIDLLCTALFNGIGRSKAFGCGLMMVKRI